MRSLITLAVFVAGIGQAQALSCLAPSVQTSFTAASDAEESYVMAVGRLTPLPGETPPEQPADPNDRKGYTLQTQFDGNLATLDGFTDASRFFVTVEVVCAGPWCGAVPSDEMLFFIERRGDQNVLVEGPCPQYALPATEQVVDGAMSCVTGRGCTPPE
ncbi:MAG: hypothetical protein AAFY65_09935 [Pseudomonadota bacterium]